MSRTNELLRQMMDDPSGEMLRPMRKTVLLPQPDGSIIRRVTDRAGKVAEDTISAEQRLSLDAASRDVATTVCRPVGNFRADIARL
jgi:hypothetical protein